MLVDACEVHTGPAQALPQPNEFLNCAVNDMESQCNIPSFVWSGRYTSTSCIVLARGFVINLTGSNLTPI